jgi:hypothetical protein
MEANESVVGADMMNFGIVGMQTDGKSVMEAGESIVVAVVADDIVMDVQMDGESIEDAKENVVGVYTDDRRAAVAVVMGAFVLDAGTSSFHDISDAESIVDAEASCADGFFDSGKMVMEKKAPEQEHIMQQGQSLWKGIPYPGGVKQYVMQQECVIKQQNSLWKQILDSGGVEQFGAEVHGNEEVGLEEVDPGGGDTIEDNQRAYIGQFMMSWRTVLIS